MQGSFIKIDKRQVMFIDINKLPFWGERGMGVEGANKLVNGQINDVSHPYSTSLPPNSAEQKRERPFTRPLTVYNQAMKSRSRPNEFEQSICMH